MRMVQVGKGDGVEVLIGKGLRYKTELGIGVVTKEELETVVVQMIEVAIENCCGDSGGDFCRRDRSSSGEGDLGRIERGICSSIRRRG